MIAKLLPVLLVLSGLGAGVGAGLVLRPDPPAPMAEGEIPPDPVPDQALALHEMRSQFMVPLVEEARVTSMVVLHLALEIPEMHKDMVAAAEPRLRDRLLQVMFDHANAGGFDGMFTANNTMALLRQALLETAQSVLGRDVVRGVLITDILRSAT